MEEYKSDEGKWDYTEDNKPESQTTDYDPEELERARIRMKAEKDSRQPHEYQKGQERDIGMTNRDMNDQALEIMAQEEFGKSVSQLTDKEYKWIEDLMNDYGNTINPKDKPTGESLATEIEHKKCPHCNFETSYKPDDLWQETDADEELDAHLRNKHDINESKANEGVFEDNFKVKYVMDQDGMYKCKHCGAWLDIYNIGSFSPEEVAKHHMKTEHGITTESKANEEQINPETYHYDYSDYWKKGNSYVRAGLAIGAGLSTDVSNKEWDELTREEQTKVLDSGYATSYESNANEGIYGGISMKTYHIMKDGKKIDSIYGTYGTAKDKADQLGGDQIYDAGDFHMTDYGKGESLATESDGRHCAIWKATDGKWYMELAVSSHNPDDYEYFGPYNSQDDAWDRVIRNGHHSNPGGFSMDDFGTKPPPSNLSRESLATEEWSDKKCSKCKGKGYNDHWDNMYGSTKPSCDYCQGTGKTWIDSESFATEKGETYIFMWRAMSEGQKEQMLIDVGIDDLSAKNIRWEELPEDYKDSLKVKMNQLFRDTASDESYANESIKNIDDAILFMTNERDIYEGDSTRLGQYYDRQHSLDWLHEYKKKGIKKVELEFTHAGYNITAINKKEAEEKNPTAREWWEEEGWKDADWNWGLKNYSTHWNELSKEQQDTITSKFNAMIDEEPTLFESKAEEESTISVSGPPAGTQPPANVWDDLDKSEEEFVNEGGVGSGRKPEGGGFGNDQQGRTEKDPLYGTGNSTPEEMRKYYEEDIEKFENEIKSGAPKEFVQQKIDAWKQKIKTLNKKYPVNESKADEDNPNHEPAGSTTGGQFTTGDGGGSSNKSTDNKPKEKRVAGVVQYSEEDAKRLGKMWEQHPDDKMFKGVKGHMIQSEYGGKKIVGGRVNIASMKRENLMDKLGKLERDKDDYSKFKDWNTSNPIIAKIKEHELQAFEELQKINSKRSLSKDGHWVIEGNHLELVKPSLVYPKASAYGGYGNSEFRPRDFEVSRMTGYWNDKEVREMVKIGDTVRVNDYIRGDRTGTTDYVVTDFQYGDEEHDGVSAGGYVVSRSGFPIEDAYVLGARKNSGSARISDIRSIIRKSDIKMKSKESYANEFQPVLGGEMNSDFPSDEDINQMNSFYMAGSSVEGVKESLRHNGYSQDDIKKYISEMRRFGFKFGGEANANEFQPERQGKRVKILTGNYKGQTGTIGSVEIFGDGFSVRVDGVHNEYATGVLLEPTDVEFLGGESKWKVNTITHGKINVDLGKDANEEDAINAVKRMYFDDGYINNSDILSANKLSHEVGYIERKGGDSNHKHGALVKMELEDRNEYVCPDCGYTETIYTESVTKPKYDLYEKVKEIKVPHQNIDIPKYAWESMYGYGSATGRMSPVEDWNQGGSFEHPNSEMFADFRGLKWSELPKDIQDAWKAERDYAPYNSESYSVEVDPDCEECGGEGVVYEQSRWSEDGVRAVPCPVCGGQDDYHDTYDESYAKEDEEEGWGSNWGSPEETSRDLLESTGLTCDTCGKHFEYPEERKAFYDHLDDTGHMIGKESHVKSDVKGWLDKTFPTKYEEPQKGLDSETKADEDWYDIKDSNYKPEVLKYKAVSPNGKDLMQSNSKKEVQDLVDGLNDGSKVINNESVDDPEDINILSDLLDNELEEQKKGEDEEEDVALLLQLLAPDEKANELDSIYKQFTDPLDAQTGKGIMDSTRGYGTPEADGQDISQEDIIEKKPPKINYQYYKQYPFGRIQKGFFGEEGFGDQFGNIISKCKTCGFKGGIKEMIKHSDQTGHEDIDMLGTTKDQGLGFSAEVNKTWWENASYEEKAKELKDIGFGMGADIGDKENTLAKRSWDDLPNEARQQWNDFGNEVDYTIQQNFPDEHGWVKCPTCGIKVPWLSLDKHRTKNHDYVKEVELSTMYQARKWWDDKYKDRQWKDMNIGERQRVIMAFLRDPDTALEVNVTHYTWNGMSVSSRRDMLMDAGIFPERGYNDEGNIAGLEEYEKLTNANWDELSEHIRERLGGESHANENTVYDWLDDHFDIDQDRDQFGNLTTRYSCKLCGNDTFKGGFNEYESMGKHLRLEHNIKSPHGLMLGEGGVGSGRKPYASKDPSRKDKAHVGWKNQGIQNYLDKAEQDYDAGKTSTPDEYEYAGYHTSQEQEAKEMYDWFDKYFNLVSRNDWKPTMYVCSLCHKEFENENDDISNFFDKMENHIKSEHRITTEALDSNRCAFCGTVKDKHTDYSGHTFVPQGHVFDSDYQHTVKESSEQEGGATAPAPMGDGGEVPPTDGEDDMDDDEDDDHKRRGGIPFGYFNTRNCPEGQVYRDGKCRDKSNEYIIKCDICGKTFSEDRSYVSDKDDYHYHRKQHEKNGELPSKYTIYSDESKCENCSKEDYLNDEGLCRDCEIDIGIDREESKRDAYEGGKGSGKKGHQQWMRSLEEDPSYGECVNCKVITEKINNKCQMCGKKY